MIRILLSALIYSTVSLCCCGQSFVSEYPELTKRKLNQFFADWKSYSDSVNAAHTPSNSIIEEIIADDYSALRVGERQNKESEYKVIPQNIKVVHTTIEVDTIEFRNYFYDYYALLRSLESDTAVTYVTPNLPTNGLYLTNDIYSLLSNYVGGLSTGDDTFTPISKSNVKRLRKYIPVDYGHWGGRWWFCSFPLITEILCTPKLIIVLRRTDWCTGDKIIYVNENGKFVRSPQPIGQWIE